MRALRGAFALLLAVSLALAPALAEARAGSSGGGFSSLGSRGSRTYNAAPDAAPIQRSLTPSSPSAAPSGPVWSRPGSGYGSAPAYGYGYGGGHSFWSGLAGGLTGAWLGGLIFGHGGSSYGGAPMMAGGGFGSLLWLLLLVGVGFWIFRSARHGFGGFPYQAGGMRAPYPGGRGGPGPVGGYAPAPAAAQLDLPLGDKDFQDFGTVLAGVQRTWSERDLATMGRYVTPEMLSFFAELEADNASRGIVNHVESVQLLKGEPREAWRERGVDYATAALRWSAIDYTCRLGRRPGEPGFLVDGDPSRPIVAEEVWTFRRVPGGRWLLSAIQQAA